MILTDTWKEWMSKSLERLQRLIQFIKDCVQDKYTGQLVIDFSHGTPTDIRRNERIDLSEIE